MATETIRIMEILLVSLLFSIYYISVYHIAVNGIWGSWKRKIMAGGAVIALLLTVEPFLFFCIYKGFPFFGVYLDRYMLEPDYVFDQVEFRHRWVSAMTFILLLVGIRLAFRLITNKIKDEKKAKRQTEETKKVAENLRSLLKARSLNPHFMENFVAIAIAREAQSTNKENGNMLMMLTQLMYYQLNMDNGKQTTGWQEEWEQMENLLKMARYCNTDFCYEWEDSVELANMDITLPHGLLLMPLENALKYGKNTEQWPLRLVFNKRNNKIHICYTNYFDPLIRNKMKTSGTGFQLMEARMAGGSWPIKLSKKEEDTLFYVEIKITLNTSQTLNHEEQPIQNLDSG